MRVNLQARAATAEQRRARTRERLLAAAERVIAETGAPDASIEAFARAAQVSRGTFYNYFPTVSDLIEALSWRVAAHMDGLFLEIARRPSGPAERLAASLHAVLAAYASDPVRGWVALHLAGSGAPRLAYYEKAFHTVFNEAVREGVFRTADPTAAATLCFGTLRMLQRDVVSGAPAIQALPVVALILTAFGVEPDEANRISREQAQGVYRTARA